MLKKTAMSTLNCVLDFFVSFNALRLQQREALSRELPSLLSVVYFQNVCRLNQYLYSQKHRATIKKMMRIAIKVVVKILIITTVNYMTFMKMSISVMMSIRVMILISVITYWFANRERKTK